MTEQNYYEISSTRGVTPSSFQQGPIEFVFSVGRPNVFVPSKCYLRCDLEITVDNAQPPRTSMITFCDNPAGALFSNCYFRAGGQSVSTNNQYVQQCSILKERATRTEPYMRAHGKDTQLLVADYNERITLTSKADAQTPVLYPFKPSKGNVALDAGTRTATFDVAHGISEKYIGSTLIVGNNRYEITARTSDTVLTLAAVAADVAATGVWHVETYTSFGRYFLCHRPPLGIFDVDQPLGSGDYSLMLTPNSNFVTSVIENFGAELPVGDAGGRYNVKVHDIKLFIYTMKQEIPDSIQHLSLREMLMQQKAYSSSLQFSVPSSTKLLTVFLQDQTAGTNVRCPPCKFKTVDDSDIGLHSIQITYANVTRTTTPYKSDVSFSGGINHMVQRYYENYRELGMSDELSHETFREYMQRGAIYSFNFQNDMDSRATEVQIQFAWNGAEPTNCSVFLCAWYDKLVDITVSNGLITSVQSLSI